MNTLSRTLIVFVAVSLMPAGLVLAQNVPDKETQDALAAGKDAELAAKVAEQQAQAAQKQTQAAQQQMEAAQYQAEVENRQALVAALAAVEAPSVPAARAAVPPRVALPSFSVNSPWPLGAGGAATVLVIPTAEIKTEDLITVTEDMSVMSRIFEKNLEQAHIATARGGLLLSDNTLSALIGGRGGAMQSMYLQGYGALFLMKVDFPLSQPPQTEEKQEEETKKEETDPVWQEMRREMYEPQEAGRRKAKEPQVEYDAEKVENLKTTLIKALKHAANIRSLKQEELVILVVAGSGVSASETAMVTTSSAIVVEGRRRIVQQQPEQGGSSQTVLVIRAKKSDIDSFAKSGDYEQFRQRTQLLSCPCLGAEAGRGDPFGGRYFY